MGSFGLPEMVTPGYWLLIMVPAAKPLKSKLLLQDAAAVVRRERAKTSFMLSILCGRQKCVDADSGLGNRDARELASSPIRPLVVKFEYQMSPQRLSAIVLNADLSINGHEHPTGHGQTSVSTRWQLTSALSHIPHHRKEKIPTGWYLLRDYRGRGFTLETGNSLASLHREASD